MKIKNLKAAVTDNTKDSTEERIKEAAKIVFTRKGYAATRTRDIADEAGINLALLNYYFRSKEKLFDIIMMERVEKLLSVLGPIINDQKTKLDDKVKLLADKYFLLLAENPDLPLFVLSEIRNHFSAKRQPNQLGKLLRESYLIKQLHDKKPRLDPIQVAMTLLGMIVFPFIAKPLLFGPDKKQQLAFDRLIKERKKLIPLWFEACMRVQ